MAIRKTKKGKLFAWYELSPGNAIKITSQINHHAMNGITKPETDQAQKILIVEDEGELGLTLDLILSERDFQVNYAGTLLAADEYLQQQKPAVIILDNKLPDGYGVDFISYVRKKYPSIHIIMISGFDSARDVALNNGADIFLEKPFSLQKMNEAIDTVLV